MSRFSLRTPSVSDVESIAQVHLQGWVETYREQLPDEFFGEAALDHRRRMWAWMLGEGASADRTVAVAEVEGQVVGFGSAGPPTEENEPAPARRQLYALYVLAEHHGSGAGQALLDAVIGTDDAFLWVAKINPRARRFYERNGFRADGVEKPDDRVPTFWEVRMTRGGSATG